MMRAVAALEGPMTSNSTQDKFLWFPFSVHEWPDLGSERPDLGSERSNLGSERPDLGSERSNLGSERPDLRS